MSKTVTTKTLEHLLALHFDPRREFFVFECTLGWYGKEIVDCVAYTTDREVLCFEIKQSKADFRSKNKLSFFGNRNYFVMPYSLFLEVRDEIPKEIGVYAAIGHVEFKNRSSKNGTEYYAELIDGLKKLHCVKDSKRMDLKADKEVILSSMLRSMQRDRIEPRLTQEAENGTLLGE